MLRRVWESGFVRSNSFSSTAGIGTSPANFPAAIGKLLEQSDLSAIFEFEGDTPRSVDVDRIALRIKPLQRMKIEARNIHFLSSNGDLEPIEPCEDSFLHLRIDLRTLAFSP